MSTYTVIGKTVNGGSAISIPIWKTTSSVVFSGIPSLGEGQTVSLVYTAYGNVWKPSGSIAMSVMGSGYGFYYDTSSPLARCVDLTVTAHIVVTRDAAYETWTSAPFRLTVTNASAPTTLTEVVEEVHAARGDDDALSERLDAADATDALHLGGITANATTEATREDNAALWRTETANPATVYAVPSTRVYPTISLVATQSGTGDPAPANARAIAPSLATGELLQVAVTDGDTHDVLTATADVYGLTGATDDVDCEADTLTRSTYYMQLPATGWDDTNFTADGYFSIALDPAAAAVPAVACNLFLPATSAVADDDKIVVAGALIKVYPGDTVATDLASWHTWLGTNATYILYELATPTEESITTPEITANARASRAVAPSTVLTATANALTTPVSQMAVLYQKSAIKQTDELLAAIAALA